MKLLQLGDTHLGYDRRSYGGPEGWERADDFWLSFRHALAPAWAGEVDLVIHTGDVFDRSAPPPEVARAVVAELSELSARVPVVVLAGNHDRRGLKGSLGDGGSRLHIVDAPTRLTVQGLTLGLVPHCREAEVWAGEAATAVGSGVDFLVCHQGVSGVRVPGFTFRVGRPPETFDERHLPAGVPMVMSGHIHPRQVRPCGKVPVVYAGSTECTSFAESEDVKGSVIWEWSQKWTYRFVDGPSRPLLRIRAESDIARVTPGMYVSMDAARLREWVPRVRERGGIVSLPERVAKNPRRQARLFG